MHACNKAMNVLGMIKRTIRFRGDLEKMINMEGKSNEERLHRAYCLKLWALEERRNRQDLIEVFKMCNGLSMLKLNEFFYSSR